MATSGYLNDPFQIDITLDENPQGNATVKLRPASPAGLVLSPISLSFDETNWNTPQQVTAVLKQNPIDLGGTTNTQVVFTETTTGWGGSWNVKKDRFDLVVLKLEPNKANFTKGEIPIESAATNPYPDLRMLRVGTVPVEPSPVAGDNLIMAVRDGSTSSVVVRGQNWASVELHTQIVHNSTTLYAALVASINGSQDPAPIYSAGVVPANSSTRAIFNNSLGAGTSIAIFMGGFAGAGVGIRQNAGFYDDSANVEVDVYTWWASQGSAAAKKTTVVFTKTDAVEDVSPGNHTHVHSLSAGVDVQIPIIGSLAIAEQRNLLKFDGDTATESGVNPAQTNSQYSLVISWAEGQVSFSGWTKRVGTAFLDYNIPRLAPNQRYGNFKFDPEGEGSTSALEYPNYGVYSTGVRVDYQT